MEEQMRGAEDQKRNRNLDGEPHPATAAASTMARSTVRSREHNQALDRMLKLEQAYARVFDGPDGEQVFADLMRQGCFEQPIYSKKPLELAHSEGRRSMALHVRRMVAQGRAGDRVGIIAGRAGS